ncbi:MAG: phosphate signaling complex protein PhoU [Candidatus Aminicenantes bacterium]|nr:phosphate signaling complex protein PhoU [Candidatus Aminicenantes bacterium]
MKRQFDEELKTLQEKLLQMASLAQDSIATAIKSLEERNEEYANKVLEQEKEINLLDIKIDELCMKLFALRQPMAVDLRLITASLRISSDLERIGDQSVNIIDRTLELLKVPVLKPLIDIPRMASLAENMVKDSITAFVNRDDVLARNVCERDDEVDKLNDQIFRELLTYMMDDHTSIKRAVDLILIGRHLERIADHATNISENVIYFVLGKTIKHHCEKFNYEHED